MELCTISPRGFLIGREIWETLHPSLFVPLTQWGGGVMGRTNKVYPHPNEWTFEDTPGRVPLDRMRVREIYRALMAKKRTPPNCMANWEKRLGPGLPWRAIGENITRGLGTNRDTSSWFKNIVHRALYLKGVGGQNNACSACHQEQDNWIHLWQCPVWAGIWIPMIEDINRILPPIQGKPRARMGPEFVYLGVLDEDTTPHALPISLSLFHSIVWKFIIQDLYKISQEEHYKPNVLDILRRSIRRYETRINAHLKLAQHAYIRNKQRGEDHNNDNINKKLAPVAFINDECTEITWHPVFMDWRKAMGTIEDDTQQPVYIPEW